MIDIEHFESDPIGKSSVRGGTINGKSVGSFNDGKLTQVHEAEFSCPVRVIKVIWESELMPGYPPSKLSNSWVAKKNNTFLR